MKGRLGLIVTDASPLITLAAGETSALYVSRPPTLTLGFCCVRD
jgi:hypothetical protein